MSQMQLLTLCLLVTAATARVVEPKEKCDSAQYDSRYENCVDETEVDETELDETELDETELDETELDEMELDETELDESDLDESELDESEGDESDDESEFDGENDAIKCECGLVNKQRILGGTVVSPKRKYPWQIGLRNNTNPFDKIHCGGTIINDLWILTAAHCMINVETCRDMYDSSSSPEVLVDEHTQGDNSDNTNNTKKYSIKNKVMHPNFNCTTLEYDFFLLELTETILFNEVIMPICLPKDDSNNYTDHTGIVTGWGKRGPNYPLGSLALRETNVTILDNSVCMNFHNISAIKMCAGNSENSACKGDSGGPLYVVEKDKYVQVGVVSHGIGDCGSTLLPGIFARVSKVLPWITTTTASGKTCN